MKSLAPCPTRRSPRTPAPAQRSFHRGAGFTLLELVVVLGIFAVLSVMAYGGLGSVLTMREQVASSFERTAALQKGYLRLRNDLQQLRARPARDGYGESQPALLALAGDGVEFTRGGWRNPLSHPRPALERVSYRLDDKRRLLRESWRVLDRAQDSERTEVAVLEQVEEARWRFLEDNQWHDTWPKPSLRTDSGEAPPPRAVEVTLTLVDLGEVRWLFSASNAAPPATASRPPGGSGAPP